MLEFLALFSEPDRDFRLRFIDGSLQLFLDQRREFFLSAASDLQLTISAWKRPHRADVSDAAQFRVIHTESESRRARR